MVAGRLVPLLSAHPSPVPQHLGRSGDPGGSKNGGIQIAVLCKNSQAKRFQSKLDSQ